MIFAASFRSALRFAMTVFCLFTGLISAQSAVATDSTANHRYVTLREGTIITLRLKDHVSTRESSIGQQVRFEVEMDVLMGGRKLVAAGTQAFGSVAEMQKPGIFGTPARLCIVANSVLSVDGHRVPVKSVSLTRSGKMGTNGRHAEYLPGEDILINVKVMRDVVITI